MRIMVILYRNKRFNFTPANNYTIYKWIAFWLKLPWMVSIVFFGNVLSKMFQIFNDPTSWLHVLPKTYNITFICTCGAPSVGYTCILHVWY